jgi:hypothetical protein
MVSNQIPYAAEQGMFGAISGKDIGNTHREQGIGANGVRENSKLGNPSSNQQTFP